MRPERGDEIGVRGNPPDVAGGPVLERAVFIDGAGVGPRGTRCLGRAPAR